MYEPAGEVNEVGGDFYEVFKVDRGWAVVLGDVSGKGAAAAALTAEARHTIRTAGALSSDPVEGLRLLDRNLRGRDDVALCSIVMLVLPDEATGPAEVLVYLAGHPHPMVIRDGRSSEVGEPGPLLGVVESPDWTPARVSLEPGDHLVALHRRRDRGPARVRRPVRHRAPARRARWVSLARARGRAGSRRPGGVRGRFAPGRRRGRRDPPFRAGPKARQAGGRTGDADRVDALTQAAAAAPGSRTPRITSEARRAPSAG